MSVGLGLAALFLVLPPRYAASTVHCDRVYGRTNYGYKADADDLWWKMLDRQIDESSCDIDVLLDDGQLLGSGLESLFPFLTPLRCAAAPHPAARVRESTVAWPDAGLAENTPRAR